MQIETLHNDICISQQDGNAIRLSNNEQQGDIAIPGMYMYRVTNSIIYSTCVRVFTCCVESAN